ncbi:MAG: hypothetical protein Q9169_004394 [Polycauliona sp. 2 TL-2023]
MEGKIAGDGEEGVWLREKKTRKTSSLIDGGMGRVELFGDEYQGFTEIVAWGVEGKLIGKKGLEVDVDVIVGCLFCAGLFGGDADMYRQSVDMETL